MDHVERLRALGALFATTSLLAACGGGGSSSPPPPPPPPSSVIISGKAVDGPLQGATACYDLNDNGVCDSTDTASTAPSDASGNFSISVAAAEAGKHRAVVDVPATAIDADTGAAVGKAFTLIAPATGSSSAQSVFVSPLTTLVQQQADNTGQTLAQATSFVQTQLNLSVSPLADFTAAASAGNTTAANAARLVQLTQTQQATAVAAAVGQTDLSGGTVTQADVDKAVAKAVTGALPVIGAAVADPALAGLAGPALQTALNTAATNVVAGTGLTSSSVVVAAGIAKLPTDATATTPEAGAGMAALQYTDANNWFLRVNQSSALDNTPDANGLLHYYDVRTRMQPYAYQPTLGVADSFAQVNSKDRVGDLHWNGSAWTACTLGQRNANTVRDAQGRSTYNACDNYFKGVTTRATIDIAGQSMATVVTEKILPVVGPATYTGGGGGNGWNLNTAVLGTATFPAGSKLHLQTDVGTDNAPAYDVRPVNQVAVFSQAVADGGDARVGTVACQTAGTAVPTTSLEEMVARFPGKPCVFATQTNTDGSSLNPSEAWGLSSASLGDVPSYYASLPAGTGNYYTTVGRMRVGFTGSANGTVYYQCLVRRLDGSTRNCTAIATGTYTIATLGDARVMSFNNVPAPIQRVTSNRLFVERGGKVYYGFRNPVGIETANVRLNLAAAQAVTFQLGLPRIQPADAPKLLTGGKASTAATLKGVWGGPGTAGTDANGAVIFRFGDNGEFVMAQAAAPGAGGRPGYEKGWLDFDPATGQGGRLLEIDSNDQWGTSHPMPGEGITNVTATAIDFVGGSIPRFVDDPNGIVGMWALGSATDLNTTHFAFFANGKVLSIHPAEDQGACATARLGPPGIEWSDYTFDASTGALTIFNKIYDTSGCTGVFDSTNPNAPTSVSLPITMAIDKKSFTLPGDNPGEILTLYRIAPK